MTEQTTKRLPLSELMDTDEYRHLTPKQRLFVSAYISMGVETGVYDPVSATMMAYKCKNLETARIMHYALLSNVRIVELLNLHFQTAPIEQYLRLLDQAIRNKRLTPAQLEAIKLKGTILGFVNRTPLGRPRITQDAIPAAVQEETRKQRKRKGAKPGPKPKSETATPYDNLLKPSTV